MAMENAELADAITEINNFDLIFFRQPLPLCRTEQELQIEAEREKYSRQIKALFDEAGLNTFVCRRLFESL